jgi:hypothetical protein
VLGLTSSEHDRDLDLVAFVEELLDLAGLRVEVSGTDLRAVLHLLDRNVGALASGVTLSLRLLVLPLAVVHDPADRGVCLGRHLDEVEVLLSRDREGFRERLYPDLVAVGPYKSYFSSTDAIVDPGLVGARQRGYLGSVLMYRVGPP